MKAGLGAVLVLAGTCVAGRAAAQAVVVGPRAGSMALLPGAQVTVPIVADLAGSGGASLGSIAARLLWHPTILAYRGISAGTLGTPVVNADSAGGSLRFALADPAGVTGQPVLVNAIFAVVGATGAADTLRVTLQELTRAGTFADLLPIGTATTATMCVSTGLLGDVDTSGTVTSHDALVIVTNAVGLPIAPYTTVNGDVDGNGRVDTRDALIVLSYVVGLQVSGFRVAQVNGGACAVPAPASVQIQPGGAAVVTGERVPLSATVRDSSGAVVSGIGLVWTSADTAVVRADAGGNLVSVGPGTTLVYANASPGLRDSVAVTVSAVRHVWYVNPAVAALNGGVELGSSTYPFSTIGQAVARAGAFDSVVAAPAVYGEGVHLTRSIFLLGDSTAAGRTVIRNGTGPGVLVDGLASGGVGLHRLWIEDSFGGVVVAGNGTGVVALERVGILRSRGAGISVRRVDTVLFDQVQVQGAVLRGVEIDSVPVVHLHLVSVDLVGPDGTSGREVHAVRVATADSVAVDSVVLATAGFRLDSARVALVGHFAVRGASDAALWAIVSQRFALDSADISSVRAVGGAPWDTMPAAVGILLGGGAATARVAHVSLHGNLRPAFTLSGADSVLWSRVSVVDEHATTDVGPWTVAFSQTRRVAIEYASFTATNGTHLGFDGAGATETVTVDSCRFQGMALLAVNLGFLGISRSAFDHVPGSAVHADLVRTVSLVRVDEGNTTAVPDYSGYGGPFALDVTAADSLGVDSSAFHDNRFGGLICRSCRAVYAARSGFVRNLLDAGYVPDGQGGNIVFDGPRGPATLYGLTVANPAVVGLWLRLDGLASRTVVDSSSFTGAPVLVRSDLSGIGPSGDTLTVSRSLLRTNGTGVQAGGLSSLTLDRSTVDSASIGLYWFSPGPLTVYGSTFTNVGSIAIQATTGTVVVDSNAIGACGNAGFASGLYLGPTSGVIARNSITGCRYGVYAASGGSPQWLRIRGNTIVRDTVHVGTGLFIQDAYDSVVIVGDTIQRGLGSGIEMAGNYSGIASVQVDSNVVQGMLGYGISISGTIAPVAMRYNTLADNDVGLYSWVPVQGVFNTVVRNASFGAVFNNASQSAFRSGNFVGNVHLAVSNDYGAPPPVLADNSWWGDPSGPRCAGPCNPLAAGDSVGQFVAFPPPASALVPGAPPIPAILPPGAPPFRGAPRLRVLPPRPVAPPVTRPTPVAGPRPAGVRP